MGWGGVIVDISETLQVVAFPRVATMDLDEAAARNGVHMILQSGGALGQTLRAGGVPDDLKRRRGAVLESVVRFDVRLGLFYIYSDFGIVKLSS